VSSNLVLVVFCFFIFECVDRFDRKALLDYPRLCKKVDSEEYDLDRIMRPKWQEMADHDRCSEHRSVDQFEVVVLLEVQHPGYYRKERPADLHRGDNYHGWKEFKSLVSPDEECN